MKGKSSKVKGWLLGSVFGSAGIRVWVMSLMLFAITFQPSYAQTFGEWFNQKKTLISYLVQQIAALQQYHTFIRQGYNISQNGLGNIGNWVKGEFNMHSAYYNSLRKVNPEIRRNGKADSCISWAMLIAQELDRLKGLNGGTGFGEAGLSSGGLSAGEMNYVSRVRSAVLAETDQDLAELQLVMTDGEAGLSDDERIRRLDEITARVKDKLVFSRDFYVQVRLLLLGRKLELNDLGSLRRYHEID